MLNDTLLETVIKTQTTFATAVANLGTEVAENNELAHQTVDYLKNTTGLQTQLNLLKAELKADYELRITSAIKNLVTTVTVIAFIIGLILTTAVFIIDHGNKNAIGLEMKILREQLVKEKLLTQPKSSSEE